MDAPRGAPLDPDGSWLAGGGAAQRPGTRRHREPGRHGAQNGELECNRGPRLDRVGRDDPFDDAREDDEEGGRDEGDDHLKDESDPEDGLGDYLEGGTVDQSSFGELQPREPHYLENAEAEEATEETRRGTGVTARDPQCHSRECHHHRAQSDRDRKAPRSVPGDFQQFGPMVCIGSDQHEGHEVGEDHT